MVSSDGLVDVIEKKHLTRYELHTVLELFFDVLLHGMAEYVTMLYYRQIDVPRVPRLHQLRLTAAIE